MTVSPIMKGRSSLESNAFAEKIYAPNDFGWEKFCHERSYWDSVPWNDNTVVQNEKVLEFIKNNLSNAIHQVLKSNKEYNLSPTEVNNLIKESCQFAIKLFSLAPEQRNTLLTQWYESFDAKIIRAVEISTANLEQIKKISIQPKEQFIHTQMEHFRRYIEPAAWRLTAYLLSQDNVETYESHTNTRYRDNGVRDKADGYKMPNGVWFKVSPPDSTSPGCFAALSSSQSTWKTETAFYFAKLHQRQIESEGSFLQSIKQLLTADIYQVDIPENANRLPSKQFNTHKPCEDNLGFSHIQAMQINHVTYQEGDETLEQAIDYVTHCVHNEKELKNSHTLK